MLGVIFSAIFDMIVKWGKSFFTINRDQEIGSLKEYNKTLSETLDEVKKADAARNDPVLLDSVRNRFQRD